MNVRKLLFQFLFFISIFSVSSREMNKSEATDYELNTEKIVVFKDGYCLVVRRLSAETNNNGTIVINEVPKDAVLGSFWAISKNDPLVSMKAEQNESSEVIFGESFCTNYLDIVKANIGKDCIYKGHDGQQYSGVISEVLATEYFYPGANYDNNSNNRGTTNGTGFTSQLSGDLFVLKNGLDKYILPASGIKTLTIKNAEYKRPWTYTEKRNREQLVLQFRKPASKQDVLLFYFTKGINWIPSYRVDLHKDDNTAKLSLQAEIVNNLIDIDSAQLELVIGVPNIKFKDINSPMGLELMVTGTLESMNTDNTGFDNSMLSNAVFSQARSDNADYNNQQSARSNSETPGFIAADAVQDFYVFKLDKIELSKGSVLSVPLFTDIVACKDIYVWHKKIMEGDSEYTRNAGITDPYRLNDVWHYLELENTSKWPWTTGPAMVMQGFSPLGQDLLKYTAMGGKVRIPLNVATDIHASLKINESDRKENALKLNRQYYTRIEKELELTVKNFSANAIELEIQLETGGKIKKAADNAEISLDSYHQEDWTDAYRMKMNNHSTVVWKKNIEAGKSYITECSLHYHILE